MVNNAQDIYTIINQNKAKFQQLGINKLGLFGSYTTNLQNSNSDIDLLVEFSQGKKSFKNFMAASNLSENLFGKKVDLITTESLSPHIGPHILKKVQYVQIAS